MAEPLEVEGIIDDPCDALAVEQLAELGIDGPGTSGSDSGDPECRWSLSTSSLHVVAISPIVSETNGLDDVYARKEIMKYFEPTTIDGYPAVYANVIDQRSSGNCTLWVGMTDELAVEVATHFLQVDPCPVAEQAAVAMLEQHGA